MINRLVKGKTAAFIDSSNIYFAQKEKGWQFDFAKLKGYLEQEADVWKLFFYTAYDPEHTNKGHVAIELLKEAKFVDIKKLRQFVSK